MKEKEKELNVKNDKPDIKNKYYELGWFSTKINTITINSLKDICDWIEAMCELAEKGSKRQIWGAKKKDDRGMLGILKVCNDNDFDKLKKLPHGIFDCVNLKNLLDEINKCVKKTNRGRTKQPGFSKSLENCEKLLEQLIRKINSAACELQSINGTYKSGALTNLSLLGSTIYIHTSVPILQAIDCDEYLSKLNEVTECLNKIVMENKMEITSNYHPDQICKETVNNAMDVLATNLNACDEMTQYWLNETIVKPTIAKKTKLNIKKIINALKSHSINLDMKPL